MANSTGSLQDQIAAHLVTYVREAMATADRVSLKMGRKYLQKVLQCDLSEHKQFIKEKVNEIVQKEEREAALVEYTKQNAVRVAEAANPQIRRQIVQGGLGSPTYATSPTLPFTKRQPKRPTREFTPTVGISSGARVTTTPVGSSIAVECEPLFVLPYDLPPKHQLEQNEEESHGNMQPDRDNANTSTTPPPSSFHNYLLCCSMAPLQQHLYSSYIHLNTTEDIAQSRDVKADLDVKELVLQLITFHPSVVLRLIGVGEDLINDEIFDECGNRKMEGASGRGSKRYRCFVCTRFVKNGKDCPYCGKQYNQKDWKTLCLPPRNDNHYRRHKPELVTIWKRLVSIGEDNRFSSDREKVLHWATMSGKLDVSIKLLGSLIRNEGEKVLCLTNDHVNGYTIYHCLRVLGVKNLQFNEYATRSQLLCLMEWMLTVQSALCIGNTDEIMSALREEDSPLAAAKLQMGHITRIVFIDVPKSEPGVRAIQIRATRAKSYFLFCPGSIEEYDMYSLFSISRFPPNFGAEFNYTIPPTTRVRSPYFQYSDCLYYLTHLLQNNKAKDKTALLTSTATTTPQQTSDQSTGATQGADRISEQSSDPPSVADEPTSPPQREHQSAAGSRSEAGSSAINNGTGHPEEQPTHNKGTDEDQQEGANHNEIQQEGDDTECESAADDEIFFEYWVSPEHQWATKMDGTEVHQAELDLHHFMSEYAYYGRPEIGPSSGEFDPLATHTQPEGSPRLVDSMNSPTDDLDDFDGTLHSSSQQPHMNSIPNPFLRGSKGVRRQSSRSQDGATDVAEEGEEDGWAEGRDKPKPKKKSNKRTPKEIANLGPPVLNETELMNLSVLQLQDEFRKWKNLGYINANSKMLRRKADLTEELVSVLCKHGDALRRQLGNQPRPEPMEELPTPDRIPVPPMDLDGSPSTRTFTAMQGFGVTNPSTQQQAFTAMQQDVSSMLLQTVQQQLQGQVDGVDDQEDNEQNEVATTNKDEGPQILKENVARGNTVAVSAERGQVVTVASSTSSTETTEEVTTSTPGNDAPKQTQSSRYPTPTPIKEEQCSTLPTPVTLPNSTAEQKVKHENNLHPATSGVEELIPDTFATPKSQTYDYLENEYYSESELPPVLLEECRGTSCGHRVVSDNLLDCFLGFFDGKARRRVVKTALGRVKRVRSGGPKQGKTNSSRPKPKAPSRRKDLAPTRIWDSDVPSQQRDYVFKRENDTLDGTNSTASQEQSNVHIPQAIYGQNVTQQMLILQQYQQVIAAAQKQVQLASGASPTLQPVTSVQPQVISQLQQPLQQQSIQAGTVEGSQAQSGDTNPGTTDDTHKSEDPPGNTESTSVQPTLEGQTDGVDDRPPARKKQRIHTLCGQLDGVDSEQENNIQATNTTAHTSTCTPPHTQLQATEHAGAPSTTLGPPLQETQVVQGDSQPRQSSEHAPDTTTLPGDAQPHQVIEPQIRKRLRPDDEHDTHFQGATKQPRKSGDGVEFSPAGSPCKYTAPSLTGNANTNSTTTTDASSPQHCTPAPPPDTSSPQVTLPIPWSVKQEPGRVAETTPQSEPTPASSSTATTQQQEEKSLSLPVGSTQQPEQQQILPSQRIAQQPNLNLFHSVGQAAHTKNDQQRTSHSHSPQSHKSVSSTRPDRESAPQKQEGLFTPAYMSLEPEPRPQKPKPFIETVPAPKACNLQAVIQFSWHKMKDKRIHHTFFRKAPRLMKRLFILSQWLDVDKVMGGIKGGRHLDDDFMLMYTRLHGTCIKKLDKENATKEWTLCYQHAKEGDKFSEMKQRLRTLEIQAIDYIADTASVAIRHKQGKEVDVRRMLDDGRAICVEQKIAELTYLAHKVHCMHVKAKQQAALSVLQRCLETFRIQSIEAQRKVDIILQDCADALHGTDPQVLAAKVALEQCRPAEEYNQLARLHLSQLFVQPQPPPVPQPQPQQTWAQHSPHQQVQSGQTTSASWHSRGTTAPHPLATPQAVQAPLSLTNPTASSSPSQPIIASAGVIPAAPEQEQKIGWGHQNVNTNIN